MDVSDKIVAAEKLVSKLEEERQAGKKIVFTNGCFDILHVGHVRYLAAARSEGDLLVVGLNSDISVRSIKGDRRPLVNQDQRAEVLASLVWVDYVVVFDEPDPLRLIQTLKPDVLVKGADWGEENIIGAEFVKATGGRIIRAALVPEASTTCIIERIVKRFC
ncbi:MAG: D-glycero-beta-D-manno-heptose 1-phosphate adenylyltransferase [Desulfobacterales bacterium]|jgi:rfaE bifunctional protein nucleotidyltransferase chain/domain